MTSRKQPSPLSTLGRVTQPEGGHGWRAGHSTCWRFQDEFLSSYRADQLLQVQGGRLTLLQ